MQWPLHCPFSKRKVTWTTLRPTGGGVLGWWREDEGRGLSGLLLGGPPTPLVWGVPAGQGWPGRPLEQGPVLAVPPVRQRGVACGGHHGQCALEKARHAASQYLLDPPPPSPTPLLKGLGHFVSSPCGRRKLARGGAGEGKGPSNGCIGKGGGTPCVTYSPSVVSLRGPGQSPVHSSPHDAVLIFS